MDVERFLVGAEVVDESLCRRRLVDRWYFEGQAIWHQAGRTVESEAA